MATIDLAAPYDLCLAASPDMSFEKKSKLDKFDDFHSPVFNIHFCTANFMQAVFTGANVS